MIFDMVILGAGPAGGAAAIMAARAGLRVALVEQRPSPRPRPGETLHPGLEPLFAKLGVRDRILAAGFHRHRGVWVEWDQPRTFHAYGEGTDGEWRGFQAERSVLDRIFWEAAGEAGAELLLGEKAADVLLEAGRVVGVRMDRREITARWVADATGWRHWLARKLDLPVQPRGPPLFVRFGWGETPAGHDGEPSLRATASGWEWRAPLAGGRTAYCRLGAGREPAGRPVGELMRDVTWRCVSPVAGPGYFLLGDAAAVLDPLSSHGVLRAVMSGIFVAHGADAVHRGVIAEVAASANYCQWHNNFFEHDLAELTQLYQRHPHVVGLFS